MLGLNSVGRSRAALAEQGFSITFCKDRLSFKEGFLSWEGWCRTITSVFGRLGRRAEFKVLLGCIARPYLEKEREEEEQEARGNKKKKNIKSGF